MTHTTGGFLQHRVQTCGFQSLHCWPLWLPSCSDGVPALLWCIGCSIEGLGVVSWPFFNLFPSGGEEAACTPRCGTRVCT